MDRLATVLKRIDEANAADPTAEETGDGPKPTALLYGHRMSEVLRDFAPQSSHELRIAARGQHIERWKRPRDHYPEGRDGYLNWRRDAAQYHVGRVSTLMQEAGYETASCDRVSALMSKKHMKTDPEAQTLEDVACLVFFRWYALTFSEKHETERIFTIVTKTARKMSAKGRSAALDLDMPADVVAAISSVT